MNAAEFNALHAVGTPVVAYPDLRPDDPFVVAARTRRTAIGRPNPEASDLCPQIVTRTRSRAQVLGGHTDVVWVDGHGACIALSHVDVITASTAEEA